MSEDLNTQQPSAGRIGFTCAYTPLPLIHAAGFTPHRLLPIGDAPDHAGALLHDNMCPHVKRVLDRAVAGELPELAGLVVMNSCDTMRRLADAWRSIRPSDRLVLVNLPVAASELAVSYLAGELAKLRETLAAWAGRPAADDALADSVAIYNRLAVALERLQACSGSFSAGGARAGRGALQEVFNRTVTAPVEEVLDEVLALADVAERESRDRGGGAVPLFLFGNVMADPAAFDLFETCGGRVVGDDLCTGSRQLTTVESDGADLVSLIARSMLQRPACARTLATKTEARDRLAEQVLAGVRASGARGVIAHVMKFCDPYLARLPAVGRRLEEAGVPLLVLEGDCTTRSLGQHATRIEAFVEMLEM